ncbi:MAG: hypothetical protein U9R24_07340, partial [Thermodesulfobacteriota bacterium]|nr:hypothetical protein [Thermodesulfobacteriota bacterium]
IFDSKTDIKCSCGAGHVFTTSWAKLKAGYGCKYCSLDKVKNKLKLSYEYIVEKFDEEQYTVITDEYINAFSKIKYICPNGHEGTVRWNDWQQGVRCSRCSVTVSKGHNYLISYIEDLGVEYLVNDRKLLGGLELDIVVPEKKIAIEYCGLYWHSEKAGKDSKYHIKKLDLCTEKGYKLITIFEDEFINKKKLVLTKIAYILGHKPPKRVYARQCVVGIVSSVASREFLSKHHIQS